MRVHRLASSGAIAACLLLAACQLPGTLATPKPTARASSAASPTPSPSPSPSLPPPTPSPSTPSPAPTTQLTLTGAISGSPSSLRAGTPCGKVQGGFYVSLSFFEGAAEYMLTISVAEYTGPGAYGAPPVRVSMHPIQSPPVLYSGTSGSVVINADERSGSLNELLASQSSQVRVSGSWVCD